jgi:hypothetical protein
MRNSSVFLLPALVLFTITTSAATFTPTSTSDFPVSGSGISVNTSTGVISGGAGSGFITLRSAVIAANANSGSTVNIPAGTYTLTIAGDDGNGDPNPAIGDLDVLASITLKGAGPANTIIQAGTNPNNGIDQIFTLNAYYTSTGFSAVVNGFTATVTGITFRYGRCVNVNTQSGSYVGGAISFDAGYNNGSPVTTPGSLTISNCVFDSNSSQYGGGAIFTFDGGTVNIVNTTFSNNGIGFPNASTSSGGALGLGNTTINSGAYTLSNCTFVNNIATSGGAIAIFGGNPATSIHNCLIESNMSYGEGGGLYSVGTTTIDQGTIISNNLSAGINGLDAQGGGLYLSAGPMVISNCTIVSNVASLTSSDQRGGGIAVGGTLTSTGGAPSTVTVVDCRIFGNSAATGTGLHKDLNQGTVVVNNNWWGNNGGPGVGGADSAVIGGTGSGGGVLTLTSWLQLAFSASPTTILTGGTSTLTATLNKNSGGTGGFSVPDGTPITFAGVLGTPSPAKTSLTSSTATSIFTAGANGGAGSASATVDAQTLSAAITINQAPLITNANNVTFTVGTFGTFHVGATGVPTPGLSESGALPMGVTFNAGTGTLSGTPAAGTGNTYPLTFTATSSSGTNVQSFVLTVNQPPMVSCPASITTNGTAGFCQPVVQSFAATATGYPAPTITYTLAGNPITSPASFPVGTNVVNVTATSPSGTNTCSFTVTVKPGPQPRLTVTQTTNAVVLSWSSAYSCYTLQFASALASNVWRAYGGPFGSSGGFIYATNTNSVNAGFFRLQY